MEVLVSEAIALNRAIGRSGPRLERKGDRCTDKAAS